MSKKETLKKTLAKKGNAQENALEAQELNQTELNDALEGSLEAAQQIIADSTETLVKVEQVPIDSEPEMTIVEIKAEADDAVASAQLAKDEYLNLKKQLEEIKASDLPQAEKKQAPARQRWFASKTEQVTTDSGTFMLYRGQEVTDLGLAYTLRKRGIKLVNSLSEV